ncbi:MAG: NUDIX domain-containing protein [Alphaproteobacteria bacterium]|nr:NUDIX domain-containing protein [Alphaproteobacteria bacterium]
MTSIKSIRNLRRRDVRVLDRTTPFQGFFQLDLMHLRHRQFDGTWSPRIEREVFVRANAAGLLPYDPVLDRLLLVEQFRAGVFTEGSERPWTLEVVAGIIKPGETPEDVAQRETIEEAGASATQIVHVCNFYVSPGGCSEYVMLYCGRVDLKGVKSGAPAGLADEHEDIRVHVLSYAQAVKLMKRGLIDNAITIIALQWLALNRAELRRRWAAPKGRTKCSGT